MKALLTCLMVASLVLFATTAAPEMKHLSDQQLLDSLEGAAPAEVLANATVLNAMPDSTMKTIREGTNGWTCMDPGAAPMCADEGGHEWFNAYRSKGEAPQKLGFIYMLKGDAGSNTDPYATTETPDNNWVVTGAHVMIVGAEAKAMMQSYPRAAKADPSQPYVMWADTPYEHLMLPVE